MGLLDTLANILTREPKARPEYGPMSDALAEQAKGHGLTGGLLRNTPGVRSLVTEPAVSAYENLSNIAGYLGDKSKYAELTMLDNGELVRVNPNDTRPLPPTSDSVAQLATDIGMAGLGTSFATGSVPKGAIGIFAGPNAKTANLVALKEAENLAAKGADNEAIRQATGWFKGMDGKWRFEIDDSKAFVKGDPVQRVQKLREENGFWNPTINDVLYHKELYDAYPDLKRVPVDFRDGAGGAYGSGHIELGVRSLRDKSTPLHEVEHYVQDIEGFATGGNPGLMAWASPKDRPHLIKQAQELMNEWGPATYEQFWGKEVTRDGRKAYDAYLKDFNSPEGVAKRWRAAQEAAPKRIYDKLAGEIESRDVSARMNLTPEQRMATPPDLRPDAIVRYGNGPQMSVPGYVEDAAERQKNFERWAKGHDVYDVMHGTTENIAEFSKDKIKSRFPFSFGFHTTNSPREASIYADGARAKNGAVDFNPLSPFAEPVLDGAAVYPLKVRTKNPLVIKTNKTSASMEADLGRSEIIQKLYDAKKSGKPYDAVVIEAPNGNQNVISFDSKNIKSIFNRGTYGDTGDILKSLVPAAAVYGMSEILPYD